MCSILSCRLKVGISPRAHVTTATTFKWDAARTRHRTSTITLTTGHRFIPHWASNGTDESVHSNSFIIAEVKA